MSNTLKRTSGLNVGGSLLAGDDAAWTMNEIRRRLAETSSDEAVQAREKRRHINQKVREARERLTSDTGTRPAFDIELTRVYARNRHNAAIAVTIIEAAFGLALLLWLPPATVVVWLLGVLSCHALILLQVRRFLFGKSQTLPLRSWRNRFAAAEFAHATAFALIVPLLSLVPAESAAIFVIFSMLLGVSARTMLTASLGTVVYAGSLPITAAIAIFFLLMPDPSLRSLAVLAPLAQIFFIFLGKRMFRASLMSLQFQAEKDALIGELEQAKANSDEARRRAETANIAKSCFLAAMSHELRTPLNAILGFSEVLKAEVFGPHVNATYREYAGDIHSSGEHLLNLINELLDLSRIEAGRYELNEEAINLGYVVEDCHHLLKLRAKNRGLKITDVFAPDMPLLWADERAVRQITLNLLSNAIKFTPQGGEITIEVGSDTDGGQFISVRDTGPGIPEHEIPLVLSAFGQGAIAIKTAEQGAGLGLPIVQGLVDLHGGTLSIKSRLRVGTTVTVSFPASRDVSALPPIPSEQEDWFRRAS
ncbi:sensor histidine kinase [Terrihabitans sp. B22-R8]|uniref:sensor histidine kinase n=1 Tax=Terrihabitans sp. B22-R8 TaxID=3425128 RepID=UPI00403D536D